MYRLKRLGATTLRLGTSSSALRTVSPPLSVPDRSAGRFYSRCPQPLSVADRLMSPTAPPVGSNLSVPHRSVSPTAQCPQPLSVADRSVSPTAQCRRPLRRSVRVSASPIAPPVGTEYRLPLSAPTLTHSPAHSPQPQFDRRSDRPPTAARAAGAEGRGFVHPGQTTTARCRSPHFANAPSSVAPEPSNAPQAMSPHSRPD